jgi:hypothetical protein
MRVPSAAYSNDETRRALDLCLFINGMPIATFELKNSLTKQTVEDAVSQYKRDRDPRERGLPSFIELPIPHRAFVGRVQYWMVKERARHNRRLSAVLADAFMTPLPGR